MSRCRLGAGASQRDTFYLFHERQGERALAQEDVASARDHYAHALALNPANYWLIAPARQMGL